MGHSGRPLLNEIAHQSCKIWRMSSNSSLNVNKCSSQLQLELEGKQMMMKADKVIGRAVQAMRKALATLKMGSPVFTGGEGRMLNKDIRCSRQV